MFFLRWHFFGARPHHRLALAAMSSPCLSPTLPYTCHLANLPPDLSLRFVALEPDEATHTFLTENKHIHVGMTKSFIRTLLSPFVSHFDVTAFTGTSRMHLLSTAQFRTLLGTPETEPPKGRVLDIGAGDGGVTKYLAPLFEEVVTTETSWGLAWKLGQSGFKCLQVDVASEGVPDGPYDTIAILNVLDRCAKPLSILRAAREALRKPDGKLILSLVLPFSAVVFSGPERLYPDERVPIRAKTWEDGATQLVQNVLQPLGFEIDVISRAPYLSGGDDVQSFYELDCVLIVCHVKHPPEIPENSIPKNEVSH